MVMLSRQLLRLWYYWLNKIYPSQLIRDAILHSVYRTPRKEDNGLLTLSYVTLKTITRYVKDIRKKFQTTELRYKFLPRGSSSSCKARQCAESLGRSCSPRLSKLRRTLLSLLREIQPTRVRSAVPRLRVKCPALLPWRLPAQPPAFRSWKDPQLVVDQTTKNTKTE